MEAAFIITTKFWEHFFTVGNISMVPVYFMEEQHNSNTDTPATAQAIIFTRVEVEHLLKSVHQYVAIVKISVASPVECIVSA